MFIIFIGQQTHIFTSVITHTRSKFNVFFCLPLVWLGALVIFFYGQVSPLCDEM